MAKKKIKQPLKQSEPERKYEATYKMAETISPLFASLMRKPTNKKVRICIKCKNNEFLSEGPHQRLCSSCKKENERASKSQMDIIYLDQIIPQINADNHDYMIED